MPAIAPLAHCWPFFLVAAQRPNARATMHAVRVPLPSRSIDGPERADPDRLYVERGGHLRPVIWVLVVGVYIALCVLAVFAIRDMQNRGRPRSAQVLFLVLWLIPEPLMLGLAYWLLDRYRHPLGT